MNLESYQRWTKTTVQHNQAPTPLAAELLYLGCGLAGEAGEVANQLKKIHRDDNGELTRERRNKIVDEAGDTLWYLARALENCGITFEEVLNSNVAKLKRRLEADQIKGDRRLRPEQDWYAAIEAADKHGLIVECSPRCSRKCPKGLRCCEGCDRGGGFHTAKCDSRQEWFDAREARKIRARAMENSIADVARVTQEQNPHLSLPFPAAGAAGETSGNSSAGPVGSGRGERRMTESDFVQGLTEDDEEELYEVTDEDVAVWWYLKIVPSQGVMKGRTIVRVFLKVNPDAARSAARHKYGSDTVILEVSDKEISLEDKS